MIDLHMHTTFSDGNALPEDLVAAVIAQGVEAIAITDHDNTESYALAVDAAKDSNLRLIPGIEINTYWKEHEVHILGYFIDLEDDTLQALIRQHQQSRLKLVEEVCHRLQKKANLNIRVEEVLAKSRTQGSVGRPHIAQTIVEKRGAPTIGEAFKKYLDPRCETYFRRETASPHEAVEAIYESGGIPVIAHPGTMEIVESLAVDLMNYGLRGLEAYHKSHSAPIIEYHCTLAEKLGLIVTGGTDFHGPAEHYGNARSRLHIPDTVYRRFLQENDNRHQASFRAS